MLVGLGDFDERDVAFEDSRAVEGLGVAESDREIVADALPDASAVVCSGEERIGDEDSGVAFFGVGSFPEGHELDDADVLQFAGVAAAAERLDEEFGRIGKPA